MKKRIAMTVGALAVALTTASAALAATETYQLDKNHTLVGFRIRHFVTKVEGRFRDFDGTVTLDRQSPAVSRVDLTIQAASIDTNAENRDKHLRSADFFEVEKYPTITFKSTKITPKGADTFDVTGDFTMHGVTKSITVPVHHLGFLKAGKQEKTGFEIAFVLNRKDYGITWNRAVDAGSVMLGDDVEINIQVEANRTDDKPAAVPVPAPKTGG
ncbi:MAG: YceI family protein [Acidobacteriota bacterium]